MMNNSFTDMSTSITEVHNNLIVSLSGEMTNDKIEMLIEAVTQSAYKKNSKGVILNYSALSVLDSFSYLAFEKMTKSLDLMGIHVVWVGLTPGVIAGLMDINITINFDVFKTAMNLEHGLDILETIKISKESL